METRLFYLLESSRLSFQGIFKISEIFGVFQNGISIDLFFLKKHPLMKESRLIK
jgi:hypothetical protein